ncbi:MAG: VanZ family protein [Nitrospirota bacterium]|jgi:VanZ family protein
MKTIAIWLFMLLVISLYPEKRSFMVYGADKALHFMLYAITCALLFVVIRERIRGQFWKALVLSVVLASAYGLVMEVMQGVTKLRDFSLMDALANSLGAVATAAFLVVKRRKGG